MFRYTSNMMHRVELLTCKECGCYHCMARFAPNQIKDWCDEDEHGVRQTALCPYCGIDAVVGTKRDAGVDPNQLKDMWNDAFG